MAITTLANTKWLINEQPNVSVFSGQQNFQIDYTLPSSSAIFHTQGFGGLSIIPISTGIRIRLTGPYNYYSGGWRISVLNILEEQGTGRWYYGREISIAGGRDEENADLIAWFEANATQIPVISLQEKEVTPTAHKQTITPDAGYDGLSAVIVNPATSDTLIPQNIKHGINIFGVIGTYRGQDIIDKNTQIAFNNQINIIRGDKLDLDLAVNLNNDDTEPILIDFADPFYRNYKIYFGLMEPNQAFEDSILYKEYLIDDSFVHDSTNLTDSGDLIIKLQSEDTFCMHPGKYFYSIKLKDPNTNQISTVINNCEINIL